MSWDDFKQKRKEEADKEAEAEREASKYVAHKDISCGTFWPCLKCSTSDSAVN